MLMGDIDVLLEALGLDLHRKKQDLHRKKQDIKSVTQQGLNIQ